MQETRILLRNLEIQVGQLSKQALERPPNTLPSDTVTNSREECKVIHLRSGKLTDSEAKVSEEPIEKEAPEEANSKVEHDPPRHLDNPFLVDLEQYPVKPKAFEYKPKMPYLQRLQKASKDKQFSRFLEVFRKYQINILFAEALEQMPLYAKFMKELLTNKKNWKESETVMLTKECSAIIQQDLPEKMQDLGSFLISCTIEDITIKKVLCDLGASINLMLLSLMRKLQIDEVKRTHGKNATIILGRPFLAIGRVLIDVQKGELTLRVNEEEVVLIVFEALQYPSDSNGCMRVDHQ
ncbi:uncharacterized protein [Arachis hypogaea]|uniref:uncharacterized protein n=1 Tax=Arachis hypogaea TaxID=3818 RepID=UPI000DED208B|nr:uncharacterized protein LOC112735655 [Arachis hypogaea]